MEGKWEVGRGFKGGGILGRSGQGMIARRGAEE